MNTLRRATFAGSWYPKKSSIVKEKISKWFGDVSISGLECVKGVVVPHAGWTYSGRIAAESFAHMQGMDVERVIVLGPCHRLYTSKCLLTSATQVETPLGILDVDTECQQKLDKDNIFGRCRVRDEENEHSLEIELPFVYHLFGSKAKIVMIMVGDVSEKQKTEYAKALTPYVKDPKTVFVISSDFCHWGNDFDYTPYDKSKGAIWESISAMDRRGAALIEAQDPEGFHNYILETENTICGSNCIEIFLQALRLSEVKTQTTMLRYEQSNKVVDPYDMSVSYCALKTVISE